MKKYHLGVGIHLSHRFTVISNKNIGMLNGKDGKRDLRIN
jgi:hypothetical protein